MDRKITELSSIQSFEGTEYFVLASEQHNENYKMKVSDFVDQVTFDEIDEELSLTSKNPVANKTITIEINKLDERIDELEQGGNGGDAIDLKISNVKTETLDAGNQARVEIKDLGTVNNTKSFAFAFGIPKGEKGERGEKGEQGAPGIGKDGEITRTIFAFKSSLTKPETPTGGSWNFEANSITYPDGWSGSDNLAHPVWMSNATFNKDGIVQDWSEPIQITGDDGVNGTDGVSSEFIFKAFTEEQPNLEAPYSDPRVDDFQTDGWSDHPTGVSEEMQYEYMCIRYKDTDTGLWGPFSKPSLWSKWGADGRDGDGVEYIYQITRTNDQPATPGKNPSSDSPTTNYQESEFIPVSSGEKPWTDNPTGVTEQYAYEWVSVRKYKKNEQMWGDFSEPALWAKYGADGQNGEDGTSVTILGSYDTYEQLEAAWKSGTLKGNNPPQMGDGYLVNGDLWVFDGDDFYNCGQIKGPQGDPGQDGLSTYVHIKYAEYLDSSGNGVFTEDTGNGIGETPGKYIGVLLNYTEADSTNPADYTWSRFQGNDGFGYEYIFKRSEDFVAPTIPTTITASNIAPDGWTDDPVGVDATNKYEWCCYRKSDEDGNWGPWRGKKEDSAKAWLFAMYAESIGIPGATGNPGPVLYPAGEWISGAYSQTFNDQEVATATPYVVYNNMHYVLMVPSTTSTPGVGTDWQKMENFSALYTDILLADRATVGNACFYGNYMFSQQGEGNLADFDIYTSNPYEGSGFKPAWCVNLVTGEMWTGTGNSYFAADGDGYLANNKLSWDSSGNLSIGDNSAYFSTSGTGYIANGDIKWRNSQLIIGESSKFSNAVKIDDLGITVTDSDVIYGETNVPTSYDSVEIGSNYITIDSISSLNPKLGGSITITANGITKYDYLNGKTTSTNWPGSNTDNPSVGNTIEFVTDVPSSPVEGVLYVFI